MKYCVNSKQSIGWRKVDVCTVGLFGLELALRTPLDSGELVFTSWEKLGVSVTALPYSSCQHEDARQFDVVYTVSIW